MYSINKHCFKEFKIAPGHRANYAILCNPEFKMNKIKNEKLFGV